MIIFENLIIMFPSILMFCLMEYQTLTVYHILCLYSMFLLFTRVIALPSPFVLWSWNLLFRRVYKGLETRKVLLNFIYSPKSSCTFIQLCWQWDTQFNKRFHYRNIPTNIALVKVK